MFAVAAGATGSAHAAWLVTGSSSSCGEQGCFDRGGQHSQTFSAANFLGPANINAVVFDRGLVRGFGDRTFTVSLWVNGGQTEVGSLGHFMVDPTHGGLFTLRGQDVLYDPSWGDLTMRIQLDDYSGGGFGGSGGFGSGGFGPGGFGGGKSGSARAPGEGGGGGAPEGGPNPLRAASLVNLAAPIEETPSAVLAPIPEPQTWALAILGLAGVGAALRRRPLPRSI